jgi:hypothetical protein
MTEQDFKDAWDAYCEYLKRFQDGERSLTAPEFLWRWFADRPL